jgi:hypothetical protein
MMDVVMFRAVHVLRDAGTAFFCLIGTKEVWVPLTEIRYGSEVARIGDRGRLIISQWLAQNMGLRGGDTWEDREAWR